MEAHAAVSHVLSHGVGINTLLLPVDLVRELKFSDPTRGPSRLRLSEFVQISEFFNIYITDICQTSESFAKSVKLK